MKRCGRSCSQAPAFSIMDFLDLIWDIINGFFNMVFNRDSGNPFIYVMGLSIIAMISIYTFNLIFKKR